MENRYMPYDIQQKDLEVVEEYARNYSYYYMNGNDTARVLGCTNIFKDLITIFDRKASLHSAGNSS